MANIDQLQIEISTKSEDAVKGLTDLKKALFSLKRLGKSTELDDLATKLEKISKIRFDNLKQINKLGETFKQVNRLTREVKDLSKKMSNIPDTLDVGAKSSGLADPLSETDPTTHTLEVDANTKNALMCIDTVNTALAELPKSVDIKINTQGAESAKATAQGITREMVDNLINSATAADLLRVKLESVKEQLARLMADPNADKGAMANLIQKAQKLQLEIDKATGKFKTFGKETQKSAKKAQGGLMQLFKIVVLYGTAFRLWSVFTTGISDGLNNIAHYSKETSTAMNKLSTMSLQVKNSIAAALYPVIVAMTPALQAMANAVIKALNAFNQFVAVLSGKNTYIRAKEYLKEYGTTAKKTANEIKKSFAGMDEITVIGQQSGSDSGSSGDDPTQMFEEVAIDSSIKDSLGDILGIVGAIGAGFASWAIGKGLVDGINWLKTIKPTDFSWGFSIVGGLSFLGDLDQIRRAIKDIAENGANFSNVTDLLGGFAGSIGDVLIMLGQLQWGAALKAVDGIAEIVSAISDMTTNGVDVKSVTDLIHGLSTIAFAIGIYTKNVQTIGISLSVQGITTIIGEISENWEAIKQGDWSGVDKATLAIGAIEALGGIVVAIGVFQKIKDTVDTGKATESLQEVTTVTETVDTTTSTLTSKLTSLIKNLALGIAIIAEVAVAAGLVVAAIWGLGVLLEQVGKAWQPVIDNGGTVVAAVIAGTAILVVIGAVTAALGTAGGPLIGYLGLGIAMLALMGASAALFLAEIMLVGLMLYDIQRAWQPVLDNGDGIAEAIGIGTALLVAIGVVTAALGVATVASAGLLPLAIALGTALLVELAVAFVLFCDSLIDVANKLIELSKPLDELNEILPGLEIDMNNFTDFMTKFAGAVVAFSAASVIAGIAATIDKVISFFTTDPVQRMYEEVSDQTEEFENLIPALEKINPLIEKATKLVGTYKEKMGSFESATGGSGGFLNSIVNGAKGVVNGLIGLFEGMANGVIKCINSIIKGLNKISIKLPDWAGGQTFGINIKQISEISLPRFAQGGFPEDGLFMANHGELVGKFSNGKTAVANNEQIVEGITGGVYAANQEQNGLLREQNKLLRQLVESRSNGQIDVTTITSAMQRKNRRDGKTIVPVGI